ncbi:hypothetical protein Tco_0699669 [Tanacetum coccineum]
MQNIEEDLTEKFFGKFYPPSRTNKKMKADEDEVSWDQTNNEFENWLVSKFENYMTMDRDTIFKTCEDYKDDWIYEWNDKVPWVNEKPWKLDGVWKEPIAVKNCCKPFCFKSGHSEWTTCTWRDEEYYNGGNLPRQFQVGNTIHCQDYKWYEALEDSDLKYEALRNKAALEESMNQDEESSNDAWSNYLPIDEWCDHENATNMELDVNYNAYLDIARLFNDHTTKNEDVRDLDDYLVRGDAQFNKMMKEGANYLESPTRNCRHAKLKDLR